MSRQEIIDVINQLNDNELEKVADYVKPFYFNKIGTEQAKLEEEQCQLLQLLNHTVDTGRGNFSENHDHYIYGIPRRP